ncbi:MAG: type II toxin-antitoxin system VapC family toxin [Deltaproteobacteria bacterium]|nr:type II toxin-antitoxin system VapC family toxin [Deltaproteobacteria bacterium]
MILLDTHTWIWAHSATKLLSDNVKRLIKKTQTDQRAIASISIWEFAMMVTKGHRVIELTPEIAMESCNLPGSFHKDPADRIIVATARTHNLTLLTKDRKIIEYPHVQAVW